jgi:hypothetical protein
MNIISNEQAIAELARKRKANAERGLGLDPVNGPLYMPDYETADKTLTDELGTRITELRNLYGATGTKPKATSTPFPQQTPQPQPAPQPGEAQAAPPPAAGPAPVYKVVTDPNTGKTSFVLAPPDEPIAAPPAPVPVPAPPMTAGAP